MEFKAGDVVKLKSGGPAMTIDVIHEESKPGPCASCLWFNDQAGIYQTETFGLELLIKE